MSLCFSDDEATSAGTKEESPNLVMRPPKATKATKATKRRNNQKDKGSKKKKAKTTGAPFKSRTSFTFDIDYVIQLTLQLLWNV